MFRGARPSYGATVVHITPFMVVNATYIICEGPKLDMYRFESVTPAYCQ